MMSLHFSRTTIWNNDLVLLGVDFTDKFHGESMIARLYDKSQDRCTVCTTIAYFSGQYICAAMRIVWFNLSDLCFLIKQSMTI